MAHIPTNETWIWQNDRLRASFERALADARDGKTTTVDDLDDFLEKL